MMKTIFNVIIPSVLSALILLMVYFPSSAYGQDFNKGDIYWLTSNIYHEARGESVYGQLMVGMVTLERLKSGRWGNTIKEVITAPAQFSWYADGKSNIPESMKEWNGAKAVAMFTIMIYNNNNTINHGIMHYHNDTVTPYWADDMSKIIQVGRHIFYIEK